MKVWNHIQGKFGSAGKLSAALSLREACERCSINTATA